MKQFAIALLATFVAAQNSTGNSTAPAAKQPDVFVPKVQNVVLPEGKTSADITRSNTTATVIQNTIATGSLEVLHQLTHNPAAANGDAAKNHQVFSWITLLGAADDGRNVMEIGRGIYDRPGGPRTTKTTGQYCTSLTTLDVVGADNVLPMVDQVNCTLTVVHSFTQTDRGDFSQSITAGLTTNGTDNTMKMGSEVSVSTGYATYANADANSTSLDYFQSEPVKFALDSTVALAMTGVTTVALALVSF